MEDIAGSTLKFPACRAKGLPICEPELATKKEEILPFVKIEPPAPAKTLLCDCVFEDESTTLDDEDEESFREPPTIDDDELQLEDIRAELVANQQRVDLIDNKFELNTPECPVINPCVDMQVELGKNSVHPEILQLQRNNHKLRQQLKELKQCCTASDIALKGLRTSLNRDMDKVSELQRRIGQMDSFKRNLEHERVLCSQRYRYLVREMYDHDECNRYIDKKLKSSEKDLERFVARADYKNPKHEAVDRLNLAKVHIIDVHNEMNKMGSLRNRASSLPNPRMGSEIAAFLQRNMQLFSKESH